MREHQEESEPTFWVFHLGTKTTYGPADLSTFIDWIESGRIGIHDLVAEGGQTDWTPLAQHALGSRSLTFKAIQRDLEEGPIDEKIEALERLGREGMRFPDSTELLKACLFSDTLGPTAAFALIELHCPTPKAVEKVVEQLSPAVMTKHEIILRDSGGFTVTNGIDQEGVVISRVWRQIKAIEALGDSKGAELAAERLRELINLPLSEGWRMKLIYALGSADRDRSESVLRYYSEKFSGSPVGEAADVALAASPDSTPLQLEAEYSRRRTKQRQSGCFIASAVYDGSSAPQVEVLREYRERYLAPRLWGRLFIHVYARCSPSVAKLISRRLAMKLIVRRFLDVVIRNLEGG